jgi:hypothetical protein
VFYCRCQAPTDRIPVSRAGSRLTWPAPALGPGAPRSCGARSEPTREGSGQTWLRELRSQSEFARRQLLGCPFLRVRGRPRPAILVPTALSNPVIPRARRRERVRKYTASRVFCQEVSPVRRPSWTLARSSRPRQRTALARRASAPSPGNRSRQSRTVTTVG